MLAEPDEGKRTEIVLPKFEVSGFRAPSASSLIPMIEELVEANRRIRLPRTVLAGYWLAVCQAHSRGLVSPGAASDGQALRALHHLGQGTPLWAAFAAARVQLAGWVPVHSPSGRADAARRAWRAACAAAFWLDPGSRHEAAVLRVCARAAEGERPMAAALQAAAGPRRNDG